MLAPTDKLFYCLVFQHFSRAMNLVLQQTDTETQQRYGLVVRQAYHKTLAVTIVVILRDYRIEPDYLTGGLVGTMGMYSLYSPYIICSLPPF